MEAPTPLPPPDSTLQPPPPSLWSTIVKSNLPPAPPSPNHVFVDCKSSRKGISVAVVDASAIINGDNLAGLADKFVSVREVVDEIRDPFSRQRITRLPFLVEIMEPSSEDIKKVFKFAKETGDLHTLSYVDVKLIALTYMLESQIHGTDHLKTRPPPLHTVNVKNLPEVQMPGWGDNVPNLAEWEALDQANDGGLKGDSKILPLKDLDDNVIPTMEIVSEPTDDHHLIYKNKKIYFPKREIKIDGKKMVSDGVDASNGENVDEIDDWHPAVSRSTHRRYLRRKARRESRVEDKGNDDHLVEEASPIARRGDESVSENNEVFADSAEHEVSEDENFEEELDKNDATEAVDFVGSNVSSIFDQMTLGDNNHGVPHEEAENSISTTGIEANNSSSEEDNLDDANIVEENDTGFCENVSENAEVSSNAEESMNTSIADDDSLMMRSLSDSTVACITSDYAMQNVILQIGLRLLASGGMQIHQLHRWVLKCHACNNVTQEIGKIFCPKCGNGGTLRKVSVTVDENGILLASRRPRIILRGTKFSLPLPQGGRDAVAKNLILREDQLPHKLLYPKLKKKSNNKNEFLCVEDIFSNASEKRAPLKPPVRKAIAMFSGKRNPNDNHFSRKR